jgi:hypothetical protein
MSRHPFEIECLNRHHLAAIAAERRATAPLHPDFATTDHLTRRLGRTLIRLGERLAGPDPVDARPRSTRALDHAHSLL